MDSVKKATKEILTPADWTVNARPARKMAPRIVSGAQLCKMTNIS